MTPEQRENYMLENFNEFVKSIEDIKESISQEEYDKLKAKAKDAWNYNEFIRLKKSSRQEHAS